MSRTFEDLEGAINEFCRRRDIHPSRFWKMDVAATMILNPEIKVGQAVNKTRRLFEASEISLDDNRYGRTLLEMQTAPQGHYEEPPEIDRKKYLRALKGERRKFLQALFDERGDLIEERIAHLDPDEVEAVIGAWERGYLVRGRCAITNDLEIAFMDVLDHYIIQQRKSWVKKELGKEGVERVTSQSPKLYPIVTMELSLNYLRSKEIPDERIKTYTKLLSFHSKNLSEKYKELRLRGFKLSRIRRQPNVLLASPETAERQMAHMKYD